MTDSQSGSYSVRTLTDMQIEETYRTRMTADFPAEELKPLSRIRDALSRGGYVCLGLFEDARLLAYAFFVVTGKNHLLDYFAVSGDRRGSGIGSVFLEKLKSLLPQDALIIIEVEHPAFAADAADRLMRERRREFYLRNGCRDTGEEACVFGTEYRLLELPLSAAHPAKAVRAAYLRLYQCLLPPEMFRRNIRLHG